MFDHGFNIVSQASMELDLAFPAENAVEQDPCGIFDKSLAVCKSALSKAGIGAEEIACMGIANQRGTSVAWDRATGEPLRPAISWQDARSAGLYAQIARDGWIEKMRPRSILPEGNVSLLNLHWMLENEPEVRARYQSGELLFGTVDSWLLYRLTGGKSYSISCSNASMVSGYDFLEDRWHEGYLDYFGISPSALPPVTSDSGELGVTQADIFGAPIPIYSAVADQQAASFSHRVLTKGMMKCTCGTGAFVSLCVGGQFLPAPAGMFPIATCAAGQARAFQAEGCIKTAGSALKWLREVGVIRGFSDIEPLAASVKDAGGVLFLPALAGLGAPSWDAGASGVLSGLRLSTNKAHIVYAALQGIAFRMRQISEIMQEAFCEDTRLIRVDGGLCSSDVLCGIIADTLGATVERPKIIEATALGAAEMAGLQAGFWTAQDIERPVLDKDVFEPREAAERAATATYEEWKSLF